MSTKHDYLGQRDKPSVERAGQVLAKVSGTEDSVRDSKVMMNSPVLERMKGRYRKGILELAQAGDAGRFGENFGKILVQIRKMKIEME